MTRLKQSDSIIMPFVVDHYHYFKGQGVTNLALRAVSCPKCCTFSFSQMYLHYNSFLSHCIVNLHPYSKSNLTDLDSMGFSILFGSDLQLLSTSPTSNDCSWYILLGYNHHGMLKNQPMKFVCLFVCYPNSTTYWASGKC